MRRRFLAALLVGLIVTALGVYEWLSSISGPVALFMLPGLYLGTALSGHALFPDTWAIASINFVFYFALTYGALTLWQRRKSRNNS